MRYHLALKAEAQGSVEAARREFGNLTRWKENSRAMWAGAFWEESAQDIRYGLRSMKANKLFTTLTVLSLALGIGANTAIYSFMDAIMRRALPVQHPDELALLNWRVKGKSGVVNHHDGSSYADPSGTTTSPNFPYHFYELLRDNNQVFSSLFGFATAGRLTLVIDGQAQLGEGEYISGGYFGGLGVTPAAGRLIAPSDDQPGSAPVVVLSYSFWQSRLGARASAVGESILINESPSPLQVFVRRSFSAYVRGVPLGSFYRFKPISLSISAAMKRPACASATITLIGSS